MRCSAASTSSSSRPPPRARRLCYTLPVLAGGDGEAGEGAVPVSDQGAGAGPGRRAARAQPRRQARACGRTPSTATRPATRARRSACDGDIVVSNPDMLHQAILPHHTKWAQFFENLRYVVIDEVHSYRGVFGSHVANVLRRLKRVCAFYGVSPQFILCSATIGNPKDARRGAARPRGHAITRERRAQRRQARAAVEPAGGQPGPGPARIGALAEQPHRAHGDPRGTEDARVRAVAH